MLRFLEAALFVVAAGPLWVLLFKTPPRLFPTFYAIISTLLLLWLAGTVLVAAQAPVLLHTLVVVVTAALAGVAWCGRPRYGVNRGWPPGSLSLTTSLFALAHRRFYLDQANRYGPIFKMRQFHHKAICILGLERGHRLLREHAGDLGPCPLPFTREIPHGFLRYMQADAYAMYGSLFRRALSTAALSTSAPTVSEVSRRALDAMASVCSGVSPKSVHPAPYLTRIVQRSFLCALFGISPDTESEARIEPMLRVFLKQSYTGSLTREGKRALTALRQFMPEHVAQLQRAPAPPVCTLTELRRLDPGMPDATCIDNLLFIHKIASSDVAGLLVWILALLGGKPEWNQRVPAETAGTPTDGKTDLLDRVIMEVLRLTQSEYLYRAALRDIAFEGFVLPRGWLVRLCVWESHRDPGIFPDPERFNPDRFLNADLSQAEYSPFGYGEHACNGVPLTFIIGRAVLHELQRNYTWELVGDVLPVRDFRHWSHWRPNVKVRIGRA